MLLNSHGRRCLEVSNGIQVEVSINDFDVFKNTLLIVSAMLDDERIDQAVRDEYEEMFKQLIPEVSTDE